MAEVIDLESRRRFFPPVNQRVTWQDLDGVYGRLMVGVDEDGVDALMFAEANTGDVYLLAENWTDGG